MKKITLLLLVSIMSLSAFSQTIQGSVMRSGSKLLDENRNKITYSQFGDYLEVNNPEAYDYFDKGVTQKTLGSTFAAVGAACLLGGVVTTLIDANSITNLSIGLGLDICALAFEIAAIPLIVKGSRNISKSVNIYNQSVIEQKKATSEFKLNAKGNGLSLSYSF